MPATLVYGHLENSIWNWSIPREREREREIIFRIEKYFQKIFHNFAAWYTPIRSNMRVSLSLVSGVSNIRNAQPFII